MKRRQFLIGAGSVASLGVPGILRAAPGGRRIVVAGGDLTEIVYALGAGDRIVGVDQTSNWPPEATELAQIGYVRRLSAEGVLSLGPDLLLAAHDAGPDVVFEQLAAAGVQVARAPESTDVGDIPEKIAFVGEALGLPEKAAALSAEFTASLRDVQSKVATLESAPRVLFILSIRNGAPLIGGTETTADRMITLAGGQNAGAGVNGYKPMSREAIIASAPDIVLMMEQHAERMGGVSTVMTRPEIALTPAGQSNRGVAMEGMLLLGFGPRTPAAIAQLARALHDDRAIAAGL
ncbi:MAG: ABC transporter substrate-binding protein [Pseudomonadota bacterium]